MSNMDDTYLKMVLALPDEFFKGWKWKDGDQVYLTEEIDEYSCSDDHGLYTVFDGLLANDGFLNTENWLYVRAIDFKNGRPIPSQEQLQDMMELSVPNFINEFFEFSESIPNEKEYPIFRTNMDCFTLAYVMDRKFKKYWDGENWMPR